jgi:hypothetical protein
MAALAGLIVAHGKYNLDEVGMALLAVLAVCVIGAIAWVGGRRDKQEHDEKRGRES